VALTAALFDIGGVIWESPIERIADFERATGLAAGTVTGLNRINPHDNAWARHERGELDADGFCAAFEDEARDQGFTLDAAALLAIIDGPVRPVMLKAAAALRVHGFSTAALTNNFAPLERSVPWVADLVSYFDVIVESSIEGVRKPETAFYRIALDRLGVPPEACVFLDDIGANLKAARALGMTTIKVADPLVALAELQSVTGVPLLD
jgi:putative hydrolase of the HAD superfamily